MNGNDVFTDEERAILGETAEPQAEVQAPPAKEGGEPAAEGDEPPVEGAKPPEGAKPEQTEEETAAIEQQGASVEVDAKGKTWIIDEEGARIPLKRWRESYYDTQEAKRGKEEAERKLNLFRELGPDKFYELYPADKPAGYKPPAGKPAAQDTAAPEIAALANLAITGGDHDGKTLGALYRENRDAALDMLENYLKEQLPDDPLRATRLLTRFDEGQKSAFDAERHGHEQLLQESEREISDFTTQIATELYGKAADKLTKEEEAKIGGVIKETLAWMGKTGRGGAVVADGYFLMNREKMLSEAKAKGGKEAIAALTNGGAPPSIGGSGGGAATGFGAYESMSRDQLADTIEKMTDAQAVKFYRDAPAAVKAKFPDLPWS